MLEISVLVFCEKRFSGSPVIKVPLKGGPVLTVVENVKDVRGKICGLAVVSSIGYISRTARNHDNIVKDLQELNDDEPIGNHARGFVTTEGEFLDRTVAGAWVLANGLIEPTNEDQKTP